MSTNTINYNLIKPDSHSTGWDISINGDLDIIDTQIKNRANEIGILSNLNTTNKTDLVQAINENTSQLADIPNQSYITEKAKLEDLTFKSFNYMNDSSPLIIIGDSIIEGYGVANYSDQWATKLQGLWNSQTGNNDYETWVNFAPLNGLASYGFTLAGTYSIGNLGAVKKSLIMQPNCTLTFTSDLLFLDFFYHQTPTAGSLEVRKNGTLIKTINCSGTDTLDKTSFPSAMMGQGSSTYEVKCINASVELTGIIRLNKRNFPNAINQIRCAAAGYTTADFANNEVLESIKRISSGLCYGRSKTYMIFLGTNDCWNTSLGITSSTYYNNLKIIIDKFLEERAIYDVRIILSVPNYLSDPTFPGNEPFVNYRNKIYQLAKEYNLTVIDQSTNQLLQTDINADGIHPNTSGAEKIYMGILKALSKGINKPKFYPYGSFTAGVQAIPNFTSTSITFNWCEYDNGLYHNAGNSSTTNFNIVESGIYSIQGEIGYDKNGSGTRCIWITITSSGTSKQFSRQYLPTTSADMECRLCACATVKLNAGDTVNLTAFQYSGTTLNVIDARLEICKIN